MVPSKHGFMLDDTGVAESARKGAAASASTPVHGALWFDRLTHERQCAATIPTAPSSYSLTVDGSAGANTLTVTGGDTLADAGTGAWAAALYYPAVDKWEPVIVSGISGSTVTVQDPLAYDVSSGSLDIRWDGPSALHTTQSGGKALADLLFDIDGRFLLRPSARARFSPYDGAWYSTAWVSPYYSPQYWRQYGGIANNQVAYYTLANRSDATNKQCVAEARRAVSATCSAVGHGVELPLGKQTADGMIAISVGHSGNASLAGTVTLDADGVTVATETFYGAVRRVYMDFPACAALTVRVTCADATGYTLKVGSVWVLDRPANARPPILPGEKVILVGDSWFDTSTPRGIAERLIERGAAINAEVISVGVGGTKASDGVAGIDGWIAAHKPSVAIIHYYLNDKTASVSAAQWAANIQTIVRKCLQASVLPVVMLPGGTGSVAGFEAVLNLYQFVLGEPSLRGEFITSALSAELSDATSIFNVTRKKAARIVFNATNSKAYYAAGSVATDNWVAFDPAATPATITPA